MTWQGLQGPAAPDHHPQRARLLLLHRAAAQVSEPTPHTLPTTETVRNTQNVTPMPAITSTTAAATYPRNLPPLPSSSLTSHSVPPTYIHLHCSVPSSSLTPHRPTYLHCPALLLPRSVPPSRLPPTLPDGASRRPVYVCGDSHALSPGKQADRGLWMTAVDWLK